MLLVGDLALEVLHVDVVRASALDRFLDHRADRVGVDVHVVQTGAADDEHAVAVARRAGRGTRRPSNRATSKRNCTSNLNSRLPPSAFVPDDAGGARHRFGRRARRDARRRQRRRVERVQEALEEEQEAATAGIDDAGLLEDR